MHNTVYNVAFQCMIVKISGRVTRTAKTPEILNGAAQNVIVSFRLLFEGAFTPLLCKYCLKRRRPGEGGGGRV